MGKSFINLNSRKLIVILAIIIASITLGYIYRLSLSRLLQKITGPQKTQSALFLDKPNAHLYWQALVEVAKNNKQTALSIVDAIRTGKHLPPKTTATSTIDDFFDELFIAFVKNNPQQLSALGLFDSIGIHEYNAYLNDESPEAAMQDLKEKKGYLQRLEKYSFDNLSFDQKMLYKIVHLILKQMVDEEKFLFHEYKINHFNGTLASLASTFNVTHPLQTAQDFENFLLRLSRIPEQLQQLINFANRQKDLGIIPPVFSLEKVIKMINILCPNNITQNAFFMRFAAELEKHKTPNKKALCSRAKEIIKNAVYPAYHRIEKFCVQLLKTTNANNGVWALPDGDNYYAHLLELYTSTKLSADQIHEIGLKEVARIHQEMRNYLAQKGFNNQTKTVGKLMQEFAQNSQFYYPETEAGRNACLSQFEAIVARSQQKLYRLFNIKPTTAIIVKVIPDFEAIGKSRAYYSRPSIDGTRPGTFFVNLHNIKNLPKYRMETLAIHEAVPGHHFQIAIQQKQNLHILRKGIKGFFAFYHEGWALYAEKLALENGFFSSVADKLGHLQDELWRAARLVVDTGIHRKRWSKETAIAYMEKATGINKNNINTEIERYFVSPAQACSYKIGQLKILELRQKAKTALGKNFDIRQFHDVILKEGAVSLQILEEIVDTYIRETLVQTKL